MSFWQKSLNICAIMSKINKNDRKTVITTIQSQAHLPTSNDLKENIHNIQYMRIFASYSNGLVSTIPSRRALQVGIFFDTTLA